jgi:hypothetical protein
MPLVLRTSGVAEARRWLDETGRKLRQANVSGRQFLSGRDAVLLLQDASEFHLLEPSGDLPTWPLLSMSEHGLLVHPLNGRTTKALVPKFIPAHANSVSVVFFHASRLGKPVQMCFEVLSLGRSVAASEWITVEPGEEILTKVELKSPLGCDADLIIGSKETGGQDNAWAYAKQVIISSRLTA